MFDASFRTKVLAPVIVVMALLVGVTVFVVNRRITRQFQTEAQNTLATADAVFRNLQNIRSDDLRVRFRSLPNEPRWRAAFQQGDALTLHQPLTDLLHEQDVNFVFYTSAAGKILDGEENDTTNDTTILISAFELAAFPAAKAVLQRREIVDTVRVGEKLYNVVSVPVYVEDELIGALTLGSEIGDADVRKFSQLTHAQIALLAGGHVVASTLSSAEANRQFAPLRELRDSAEAVGRGDFSRRVPVRSRDECGELAVVFNQMTENVQQSRAQLEKPSRRSRARRRN
jgi:nitrogen fixation/metabolism regulation signal transduction histidine kinase